ncbi:helix-turn-helix domain-containing protein [Vibrio crassostreae]|uniref:winged helix-turn-helix domain-containing protein n=1 Tax=Vibrio crassostreae TaxID=246167 RepID=UPI00200B380E|nr:helix-turn-helix domain-containing protein [Vibrio crassostreae]UPR30513.1 helix-turn-helix domain-containing protein [Vibrio crassostreae]
MLLHLNSKQDALELYESKPLILLNSVSLSTIEFNILSVLYENSYKPCTRQQLKQAGWPDRVVGPNSLNVCIMHLRKKVKSLIPDSEIRVVPSHGYKLLIPTAIQLVEEGELPNIKPSTVARRPKMLAPEPVLSRTLSARVKRPRIQPSVVNFDDEQQRLRWEDLILTTCIWIYAFTLYYSIYN